MAVRLPVVGGDDGNWGTILNQFLQIEHNFDGTLKSGIYLEAYGAIGDGIVDDTIAIIAALTVAQTNGAIVYGTPGHTYLIGKTSSSSSFVVSSGITTMPYCLAIPSGVTLDLRGATLKLKSGTDAILVTNAGALTGGMQTNAKIGLVNAIIDGNNQTLTSKFLIQMTDIVGLKLELKMTNVNHGGILLYNCSQVDAPRLEADTVVGQPYSFGFPTAGLGVTDSRFGLISARNVSPDLSNPFNFPGNVFYGEMQDCTIDTIRGYNCSSAVKIGVTCTDVSIGKVSLDTIGDSGGNSGLKMQGDGTGGPYRILVGQLLAKAQQAHGLWMEKCTDCTIDSYIGEGNQLLATGPDVWIGGTRDQIGNIKSRDAGQVGILIRSYATDYQIANIIITNPGSIAITNGGRVGISVSGGLGTIDSVVCVDNRGTPVMYRGIYVNATSSILRVTNIKVSGFTNSGVNVTSGASVIANILISGNPTYANIVLNGISSPITVGQAVQTFLKSGLYFSAQNNSGTNTNNTLTNGTLRLAPIFVPRTVTINSIAAEITAIGDSGSTLRFGIYADDGTGYPGTLISEGGTIPADTIAVSASTVNIFLSTGIYWIGAVLQGVTITQPTVRTNGNVTSPIGFQILPSAAGANQCYTQTGVVGALPSTFTTSPAGAGQMPRIFVRAA
jgi:hypothetical protein